MYCVRFDVCDMKSDLMLGCIETEVCNVKSDALVDVLSCVKF